MSSTTTLSLECCIHSSVATTADEQLVEIRLRRYSKLVSPSSNQIIQQTFPTPISDALFHFPLPELELENPPFFFHDLLLQFLSPADSTAIFHNISSFALQLAAGNLNLNFHLIATVDLLYTISVDLDLDPPQYSPLVRNGAPASVIERLMDEKYDDGNGREEMGDQCCVCYEDLNCEREEEKEEEVTRIPCGHVYHKYCILKWLNINNSCPLCRREFR
ncbi:E3 ubiquitin-protein ligase synoviolin B-like [Cucumis melo var. makuwa]|uniref:E3 ubiquitin-protein ligase synoviolin B-like n=2 Tax=Cucumis melo TaxID=3656 RepID=A0A5A7T784_CUCMM|nr:E3 ubiquitin-protein ligase synoviolin B-like [Cucumis melo var. makuwa]TYK31330.1 E3 ubiquitin-protein ligase synoviolin B-like [Cucumis melo var. makuwa]